MNEMKMRAYTMETTTIKKRTIKLHCRKNSKTNRLFIGFKKCRKLSNEKKNRNLKRTIERQRFEIKLRIADATP